MKATDEEIEERLRNAVAAYTGPVTVCPPGKARAPNECTRHRDRASQWLAKHWNAPRTESDLVKRRRIRMVRQRRERIATRNGALLKLIGKQEQKSAMSRTETVSSSQISRLRDVKQAYQTRLKERNNAR
jgi:hypothetical protein